MFKLIFIAAVGVLLAQACSTAKADDKNMSCAPVAFGTVGNGDRCESAEAVCFLTPQGGISCLKK